MKFAVTVMESGPGAGDHCFLAIPRARGELIAGATASAQHSLDAGLGPVRIGEVIPERRAGQFVAGVADEGLHLLVGVGDDAAGVCGHQRVNTEFGEKAGTELLVAQALIEQLLLGFRLLARCVVGADQQVADDSALRVAQGRNRYDRGKAAPILAGVSEFIDVFDAARGFEDQCLEARLNWSGQLQAKRLGARDHFLRIGNVGGRNLVHDFEGCVAQHALGSDVE